MKYIYGPVNSRRLGLSLGVSLTPHKTCSFNCVYCQLGLTHDPTAERREYLPVEEIFDELQSWLSDYPRQAEELSYITLCGAGEPVLNSGISRLIQKIKKTSRIPLAVITNASLLNAPFLREEILGADLIVPTLCAATEKVFQRINRPNQAVSLINIIDSLVELRQEFSGKIWIEVMLVKGFNDDLRQIKKLKEAIDKISPDRIHLNSPVRATAEPEVKPVSSAKLKKIKAIFGEKCEII
ncbi:MAG: radical SAM protein [Candidatus Omnitrophica bacterium]|nr:radical SAM protein [Candidatus Omnitrophota bacterium]